MKKSAVEQSEVIICEECGEPIYTCDGCHEYFVPGSVCWCDEHGKHYCDDESCEPQEKLK